MLLRRIYVFFIVLLVVTALFHLLKRLDENSRMSQAKRIHNLSEPKSPLLKTPIILGYGTIKGRGMFHRTQEQIVGRRRGRSRVDSWDLSDSSDSMDE